MAPTIEGFLNSKGGVGLLSLLYENGPLTYSEIESEIEISSSTISTRRDEAAKLGLVRISLGDGEIGTSKVHHLTDMGERLAQQMERNGVIKNYTAMRTHQDLVEQQTEEVINWVKNNTAQIEQFEEAIEGTIVEDDDDDTDRYETDLDAETAMPEELKEDDEATEYDHP